MSIVQPRRYSRPTIRVDVPHRGWRTEIFYDEKAYRYTMDVNGVWFADLPEAPKTAAQVPQFCRSQVRKLYNDTIRLVKTHSNQLKWKHSLTL